jgi:UDP-3-O-[3-hydroxymyristoyl] glucosamine N-acyltransferase
MPDPRFFPPGPPLTAGALAAATGSELADEALAGRPIASVASLSEAGAHDLSFFDNPKYKAALAQSAAGAIVLAPQHRAAAPPGAALLLNEAPYRAYAEAARLLFPPPVEPPSVAASASVHETARLGPHCVIEAGVVVGARAEIGGGVVLRANAVIGEGVVIGAACDIGANASLSHCILGVRVRVFPGARIGQDGFGFAMSPQGHVPVPQLGRVLIEDEVVIGANVCIDRGALGDTVIGRGAVIDNLVQIGHNVQIGPGCVIVAQVGIAGSTVLEPFVVLAGQVGVAGHLRIGAGAQIGAQAGLNRDVPAGAKMSGSPAVPVQQYHRQTIALARLTKGKDA